MFLPYQAYNLLSFRSSKNDKRIFYQGLRLCSSFDYSLGFVRYWIWVVFNTSPFTQELPQILQNTFSMFGKPTVSTQIFCLIFKGLSMHFWGNLWLCYHLHHYCFIAIRFPITLNLQVASFDMIAQRDIFAKHVHIKR